MLKLRPNGDLEAWILTGDSLIWNERSFISNFLVPRFIGVLIVMTGTCMGEYDISTCKSDNSNLIPTFSTSIDLPSWLERIFNFVMYVLVSSWKVNLAEDSFVSLSSLSNSTYIFIGINPISKPDSAAPSLSWVAILIFLL